MGFLDWLSGKDYNALEKEYEKLRQENKELNIKIDSLKNIIKNSAEKQSNNYVQKNTCNKPLQKNNGLQNVKEKFVHDEDFDKVYDLIKSG